MYDSIQAVLTSQLRYRAQWNESTAAKTVMSYQSRPVPRQRTVIGVDEAVEPRSRSRRDNSRFDRPPRAVVTAISCTMERKHSYENGDVIPESRIVPKRLQLLFLAFTTHIQVTISHLHPGHGGVWRLPCSPRLLAGCSLSSATLSWSDDDVYR